MTRFVVFLRGINVGGHTVTKDVLQEAFTSLGFRDVSTFKQSGNIIFNADTSDSEAVKTQIEAKLRKTLTFHVAVFVRTITQLKKLIAHNPFKGHEEKDADFQVTFLESAPTRLPFVLPVRIPKSTADVISVLGTEVFSVTRGHGDGGMPNPFLKSKLKVKATTRNWNVVREIVERFGENE
jgi:uncharacterized protein (DUF1697 family)